MIRREKTSWGFRHSTKLFGEPPLELYADTTILKGKSPETKIRLSHTPPPMTLTETVVLVNGLRAISQRAREERAKLPKVSKRKAKK